MKELDSFENIEEKGDKSLITSKNGKKWYKQAFKKSWLTDPKYKDWLRPDTLNRYSAFCIVCKCNLKGINKSCLFKHCRTSKHLKNYPSQIKFETETKDDVLALEKKSSLSSSLLKKNKLKCQWSNASVLHFINLYKHNPCLWNPSHEAYKDNDAKLSALNNILLEMKEIINNITIKDIRAKIKSIRTQFTREIKKVKVSKGIDTETEIYVPKYWCFEALSFLNDIEELNFKTDTLDIIDKKNISSNSAEMEDFCELVKGDEEGPLCEDYLKQEDENPVNSNQICKEYLKQGKNEATSSNPASMCKEYLKQGNEEMLKDVLQRRDFPENELIDEESDFAKVVGNELRKMNKLQKIIAKKIINDALFMGSMNLLNPNSEIVSAHVI